MFSKSEISSLINREFDCVCGKKHFCPIEQIFVFDGAIRELLNVIKKYGAKKPYIIADENTYKAAGNTVCNMLDENNLQYRLHVFESNGKKLEPNEKSVGEAVMDCDICDIIIGVGSGVINDICKIVKKISHLPYIIVATAPSMDGYASNSSSMIYKGVKTSISSACADVIICDTDIVKNAPKEMILAGIGDMAAKIISICEWRISNIVTGEYYCEEIAEMMRVCTKKCLDNSERVLSGDKESLKLLCEGLIVAGIAMSFAGISRPASGIEHYYSHLWEMRAIEEGRESKLHGITVGVACLLTLRKYEKLLKVVPSREIALAHAQKYNRKKWEKNVKKYFGKSAQTIIDIENKENKYSVESHAVRVEKIIANWDEIINIIQMELSSAEYLLNVFKRINFPVTLQEIDESAESADEAYLHTMDIRDKYILSRLCNDLGIIV